MSVIRSANPSSASFKNPKLYSLTKTDNNGGNSAQIFDPYRFNNTSFTDSSSIQSYDNYFRDSPTDDHVHAFSSSASVSSYSSLESSPYNQRPVLGCSMEFEMPFDSTSVATMLFGDYQEGFQADVMEFDDDKMKSKIQELEKLLLSDEDDLMEEMFLQTSSETTPKQILIHCAHVLSEGKSDQALTMVNDLRLLVSIQGDPSQRIAAYMVEGLAARMAASGKFLYKSLKCKEPPSNERLAAMQILFEICPCFKFGFLAANDAIIESLNGENEVHIIDFDINQGNQYMKLIQTVSELPGKPPRLRLTGVDDPDSVQRSVGGLSVIGQRLEQFAKDLNVSFKFKAVASTTSMVTSSKLNCKPGEETLIVNFAFQLHHMPDESVSTVNQRDELLHMVKTLNPKLVTVVEQEVNTNTSPFLSRFIDAYEYYSAVFESLDVTLPRESEERMNVERQCLARDIVNIVACEGEERIERYEVAGKWRSRMMMAGFTAQPMSSRVTNTIQNIIKQEYCTKYKVEEDMGELHFGFEDKRLIVASAWR